MGATPVCSVSGSSSQEQLRDLSTIEIRLVHVCFDLLTKNVIQLFRYLTTRYNSRWNGSVCFDQQMIDDFEEISKIAPHDYLSFERYSLKFRVWISDHLRLDLFHGVWCSRSCSSKNYCRNAIPGWMWSNEISEYPQSWLVMIPIHRLSP